MPDSLWYDGLMSVTMTRDHDGLLPTRDDDASLSVLVSCLLTHPLSRRQEGHALLVVDESL